jgi:sulfur carrier protein ThiS
MAWNDVGQEQMVSYTDAQTGGFLLKANQSQVDSNQCMTKNDALTKYLLRPENMAAYTNNQLVPKKEWVAGLTQLSSGFNGLVRDIQYQSDGKIVIGGDFTTYKGVVVNRIVRLFPDGTLDTDFISGTNFNNSVLCILILSDNRIVVVGAFITYNGTTINRFCILNPSGSLGAYFAGAGFNNGVWSVALRGNTLFIGGEFTTTPFGTANGLVAMNLDTYTRNTSFIVGSGIGSFVVGVLTIHIGVDNEIYVGGGFVTWKGASALRFIKLQDNGNLLFNYNLLTTGGGIPAVETIVVTNDLRIIAGGNFRRTSGLNTVDNIVAFDSNGNFLNIFGTGFNSQVNKISIAENNQLLVSGYFGNYNNQNIKVSVKLFFGLQIYNVNTNFTPDFNSFVYTHAINLNDYSILYGGDFTFAADPSITRSSNRIAQFSSAGVLISD